MFTLFRYGLMPVVYFCLVVVSAGVDAFSTNAVQKSTWPQTVLTVEQTQDIGRMVAEFRGEKPTFSDLRGTGTYVIDGTVYHWQGRANAIGVTAMKPGDQIKVYYNPKNAEDISTLILLGAPTGSVILAVAVAFLAFYVWFFWLRGFFRRAGPDDFAGDTAGSFADRAADALALPSEPARFVLADAGPAAVSSRPRGKSPDRKRAATFGKRSTLSN